MKTVKDLAPGDASKALELMMQKDQVMAVKNQAEARLQQIIGQLNAIFKDDATPKAVKAIKKKKKKRKN